MKSESPYLTQALFSAPNDEPSRPGLARLVLESPFGQASTAESAGAADDEQEAEASDDEQRDAQATPEPQPAFESEDQAEAVGRSAESAPAALSADQRAWVFALDRSAIERLPDAALRQRYLQGLDWSEIEFPGNVAKHQSLTDAVRSHWRLADELFSAMTAVVPERRVPSSIVFHDPAVVDLPGQPGHRLHVEARDAFVRLRDAAAADGVELVVTSSWRSRKKQAGLSSKQPNAKAVARGKSAHMYGLAVDLRLSVPGLQVAEANTRTAEKMANLVRMYRSPVYKWMALRGRDFGWHPYRREPWHWEYNPPGFKARFEGGGSTSGAAATPVQTTSGGRFWTFESETLPITVGVYAPQAALRGSPVDILLFAHGLLNVCGGPASAAGLVLHRPFNLAQIVDGGPQPVVLVVPEMNWERYRGLHPLGRPDALNGVLAEVLQALGRLQRGAAPALNRLILAGHSRAYGFLAPLARAHADPRMTQGALATLAEVWALDTTYQFNGSHDVASTRAWLEARPQLRLKIVYRRGSKTAPLALAIGARPHGRLDLIEAMRSESHCALPVVRLPGLLRSVGRSAAGMAFEDEAIAADSADEYEGDADQGALDAARDEAEFEGSKDEAGLETDFERDFAGGMSAGSRHVREGLRSGPSSPAARPQPAIDPRLQRIDCAAKLRRIGPVAVVGGGLAGLMAARELVRHGIAVSLFEARSDIGGRVFSNRTFANGRIIEEGAELIGSFHTRWLTLAREFGLAMISRMEAPLYKREGLEPQLVLESARLKPTRLTPDQFDKLNAAVEKKVLEPLAKLAEQIAFPSEPWLQATVYWDKALHTLTSLDNLSVEQALTTFFHITPRDVLNPADPLHDLFWPMLDFKLVNDEVAPLEKMNFLGLLCKVRAGQGERMFKPDADLDHPPNPGAYWDELEIFRCADGCDALARKLGNAIVAPRGEKPLGKVHKNKAVTQIHFAKDGSVTLWHKTTTDNNDGRFVDAMPAQRVEGFSHVVFAIPPSVWAGVRITTDRPGTVPEKDTVDLNQEVGGRPTMNGAVKHFSKVENRFWIKSGAAPCGGASRLGQVWEGTDNQTRVAGQDIVLSVFAGPVSKDNRVPERKEFEDRLGHLFPSTAGNPGYADSLTKVNPTLFSNWPDASFIKTGYWSPVPEEIFKISKKLTEPLQGGRLFFAGEHTDTAFFGYMEGALRSGERAANSLMLKVCGLPKKAPAGPLRVAEFENENESQYLSRPDDESFDEAEAPEGDEALPMWSEAEDGWAAEDEECESSDDEDSPLPGAELNAESAHATG